jgi:MoxR-like ATPase
MMYVLQRPLEGGNLAILEDEGREVVRHSMFRFVASGNSKGQTDEAGIYHTNNQSAAQLDRFKLFLDFQYMGADQEKGLLKRRVPNVPNWLLMATMKYVREHRTGFEQMDHQSPLSQRGLVTFLESAVDFLATSTDSTEKQRSVTRAWEATIGNRCTGDDHQVLKGYFQRTLSTPIKDNC